MQEYRSIFESEIEDFETECRANGFNPGDFDLQEHDIQTTPKDAHTFHTNGKITITCKSTSRTYNTGNATHWVMDFSNDLRAGVFNNN